MAQSRRANSKRTLRERPSWYVTSTDDLLREVTHRIVDACQPERIILFGSHAYGKPKWDSDLDLLVVTRRNARQSVFERSRQVYALFLDRAFPMDILVRSPQEVAHRLKIGDPFFRETIARGRILYERRSSGFKKPKWIIKARAIWRGGAKIRSLISFAGTVSSVLKSTSRRF